MTTRARWSWSRATPPPCTTAARCTSDWAGAPPRPPATRAARALALPVSYWGAAPAGGDCARREGGHGGVAMVRAACRVDEALRDFNAALEVDPRCALSLHARGVLRQVRRHCCGARLGSRACRSQGCRVRALLRHGAVADPMRGRVARGVAGGVVGARRARARRTPGPWRRRWRTSTRRWRCGRRAPPTCFTARRAGGRWTTCGAAWRTWAGCCSCSPGTSPRSRRCASPLAARVAAGTGPGPGLPSLELGVCSAEWRRACVCCAQRGHALRRLGDHAAALEDYDAALRLAGGSGATASSTVKLHNNRWGMGARSDTWWSVVHGRLRVSANLGALGVPSWRVRRAYCYAKLMRFEDAIRDYDAVLRLEPGNAHATHNRQALALARLAGGHLPQASGSPAAFARLSRGRAGRSACPRWSAWSCRLRRSSTTELVALRWRGCCSQSLQLSVRAGGDLPRATPRSRCNLRSRRSTPSVARRLGAWINAARSSEGMTVFPRSRESAICTHASEREREASGRVHEQEEAPHGRSPLKAAFPVCSSTALQVAALWWTRGRATRGSGPSRRLHQ